ncbi:MAG TPA: ATP-binding protein, partial [Anaerolineae bacterium]|nr:ATP-binding protein [Anaerolineae bacterium]
MEIPEKLASFFLGSAYDLTHKKAIDEPVHYDARDLTTHAVVLGMTGSGKTGLGIILLEEAALDGVPSIVIDPKGDMTNLLLTFPDLRPEDFLPWVNPDDARRKDMDLASYAAKTAADWRQGLEQTGQGPERIRRLKEAADFVIYTPGSSAGRQLSILHALKAPALSWDDEGELLRDKVASVVSALLGLVGIEADPVRSREHILLSNIVEHAWRQGEDLDLAQLILRIQKPPFAQLGVFPVDTFFPEKDRLGLAMLLNGLIASPAFAEWIKGEPLDPGRLFTSPSGKPQVSVLYIAHLSDVERQFFVTLLLEQVVSWMRQQSGTTSLRALIYMDEMFGYLPPHPANPPTKKPLLTLLKQARAFGLGLILATQNPVDLDYKALSNAGTWCIGRLQADRDKQRVLDGLEGVQVGAGGTSRAEFDRMISAVGSRVFILHNVHEGTPQVFSTRWAMSYLRGPLTRSQVKELAATQPAPPAPAVAASVPGPAGQAPRPAAAPPARAPEPAAGLPYSTVPPQLP